MTTELKNFVRKGPAMGLATFDIYRNKVIIKIADRGCETADELLSSPLFHEILSRFLADLTRKRSLLLNIFPDKSLPKSDVELLIATFKALAKMPRDPNAKPVPGSEKFLRDRENFNDFVETLYNYWRGFERFIICDSTGNDKEKHPYRTFSDTAGKLTGLVRATYRDIQENTTGTHPRIYRQVNAGAEVAAITVPQNIPFGDPAYDQLNQVPMIRQILLHPPLILNPPMNKRKGKFERVAKNPLTGLGFSKDEWLCYPAMVGPLVILIYFHKKFYELGFSLCNLFKLAEDKDLARKPDAVYAFGVPDDSLDHFGGLPTVFFDDEKNGILSGAVPGRDEFGYFGYLKKMVLTLHNIKMMKRGVLPFHGALVRIVMKGDKEATVLFIGDTGAGKSETLEAFRELGEEVIQDLIIIADDMGSLIKDKKGDIIGYGTEIGAFLRLDDLQPGYALGQIDRAIIMSANQVNARIILPVTTYENLMKGHKIDAILYANNYDEIDEDHPLIERFETPEQAMKVFREGTVMSKGTTTTSGLVHSYYANVFGPPQYKELHEPLAKTFFEDFFKANIFVGQMRTRLGLLGWERKGPEEAARELLKTIYSEK